jgi:acyl-coenzyme A synthetase/AMP-(fatty) acid ligase
MLPQAAGCVVDPEVILTPEALLAKMRAAESVFLVTTPSFLARFAEYADQYDVPQNVVELTTSGALLTAKVAAAARRAFGRAPLEIFGSTETGGVAWRRQETGDEMWTVFDPVKAWADTSGRLAVSSPFSCARRFALGDGVVFASEGRDKRGPRRFKLLGRMDRMVKIAEQRVSLPEMEATMCLLPDVAEAALGVVEGAHGPVLGAVVVPRKGWTDLKTLGKRACARSLRVQCQQFFPKGAVPRKYRFVRELPRNAQGKVQASAIQEILASQMAEPLTENEERTATSYAADLTFDRDAAYFEGHFPDCAVLPGVIQLGTAHRLAEAFIGRARPLRTVKKMKFSHVVQPGETVHFTLTKKTDDEFAYDYRRGDVPCASGVLCF